MGQGQGCGTKHVKDPTSDAYDIMQDDESVDFGRVLIRAHAGGEVIKIDAYLTNSEYETVDEETQAVTKRSKS